MEHIMNMTYENRGAPAHLAALARLTETAAAAMAGLPVQSLRGPARGGRAVTQARQVAMYLAHVVFGLSFSRVGICFGRDRTTVRHACRLVEDGRDDDAREFGLAAIELGLLAMSAALLPAIAKETLR
jgi:chromosomal replication initiation ATPase DnaA